MTFALQKRCSTTELSRHKSILRAHLGAPSICAQAGFRDQQQGELESTLKICLAKALLIWLSTVRMLTTKGSAIA